MEFFAIDTELLDIAAIPSGNRPKLTPTTDIPDSDVPIADVTLAIAAVGSSDDAADAILFISKYDSVTESDRERLTLEEFLVAAGLTPRRFVEVVTGALMQQASDVTKMLVSVAQPKVTAGLVKNATTGHPLSIGGVVVLDKNGQPIIIGGGDVKAQEIFCKITNLLPTPKGAQTIINMQQLNQGGKDDDDGEEEALQPFDDYLLEIQSVIRPQLAAPKAPDAIMPINVPELDLIDAEI